MCFAVTKTTGEIIREVREREGLSQEELAELLGVSNTYIAMIETGKRQGKFILSRIAETLRVDLDTLTGFKPLPEARMKPIRTIWREFSERYEAMNLIELAVRGSISAGLFIPSDAENEDFVRVTKEDLGMSTVRDLEQLYALKVNGPSLEGDAIHDGDFVVVNPDFTFQDGKIYVVKVGSDMAVRHVYKDNENARLVSSDGKTREVRASEVDIQGRVIYSFTPGKRH